MWVGGHAGWQEHVKEWQGTGSGGHLPSTEAIFFTTWILQQVMSSQRPMPPSLVFHPYFKVYPAYPCSSSLILTNPHPPTRAGQSLV